MSWAKNHNTNATIRMAVRADIECGRNWMGATATLADWLDVSPQIIRMRYHDEVLGAPRRAGIVEGCWRFMDYVADRQRAWLERLARQVEAERNQLQLTLPLEINPHVESSGGAHANRVGRHEAELVAARKALGDYRKTRAKKT